MKLDYNDLWDYSSTCYKLFKSTDSRHLPPTLASCDISEGLCKSLWNELVDQLWCETTMKMYLPDYSLICFIRGFYSYFPLNATPNHLLFQEKKDKQWSLQSWLWAITSWLISLSWPLASGPSNYGTQSGCYAEFRESWEKLFLPVHSLPHWKSTAESGR